MTSNSPERSKTLHAALEAVLSELEDVERQFSELVVRRDNLREAASGLQGLLGLTPRGSRNYNAKGPRSSIGVPSDARRVRSERQVPGSADLDATKSRTTAKAPQGGDATSTDRVVALLREFEGRAIPRQMILDEFGRRGWVDPEWKEPEAAIRMAIRRAVDRSEAKDVGGGRYVFTLPGLFTGDDKGEDDA